MITLPEKLSRMTPYDPCEDIYQIKLDANESFFSLPDDLRDAIAASIDTIDFNRYPRIPRGSRQYCRRQRLG